MVLNLIFILSYSLLSNISIAQLTTQFEFIAYGDNNKTLLDLRGNYWENVINSLISDTGASEAPYTWGASYTMSIILNNIQYTPKYILKPLAAITSITELKWTDSNNYNNARTLLNDFNPNSIQNYLAKYINSNMMFQVKGASSPIPGNIGELYTFNFDKCLYEKSIRDPPKIWSIGKCTATSITTNLTGNNGLKWVDIFRNYLLPNAVFKGVAVCCTNTPTIASRIEITYEYDSYCDFKQDYEHNSYSITPNELVNTFYNNYPPVMNGNITDITFECQVLSTVCESSEYCDYVLPWLNKCNYINDDCYNTTTTTPATTTTTTSATTTTTITTMMTTATSITLTSTSTTTDTNESNTVRLSFGIIMLCVFQQLV
eukprot:118280_1